MKLLIEGAKIAYLDHQYEGESPCEPGIVLSSHTHSSYWVDEPEVSKGEGKYLFEILEEIALAHRKWRFQHKNNLDDYHVFFGYHITSKPMTWEEAEEKYTAKVLGAPDDASIYHCRSDLTGYLWTEIHIEDSKGHDVYQEILSSLGGRWNVDYGKYITMLFEIKKKES